MLYFRDQYQRTSQACIVDTTPPTFTGITSIDPQTNGSLRAVFPQATDATGPVRYRIYIASGTVNAATLFVASNIVAVVEPSGAGPYGYNVYSLADQLTYLGINQTYTMGVRAVDALGNVNTNTVVLTGVSSGVLPDCLVVAAASLASTEALLQTDHANFQSDHSNFQTDHANFQTDHNNFVSDLNALQVIVSSQSVSGTAMDASLNEFTMDVTLDEETI